MNKLKLVLTIDKNGRQVIAGRTASGKSTLAKILATHTQYLYVCEEDFPEPMTAEQIIHEASTWSGDKNPGIVVDAVNPKKVVSDFDTTDIPIIYTKQLNRQAIKKLKELEDNE